MLINNIMLDVETLSTKPNAVIASLGLVRFSHHGPVDALFLQLNVDEQILGLNRSVQARTLKFWLEQNESARSSLIIDNPKNLYDSLTEIEEFILETTPPMIWASPASFDVPILSGLFEDLCVRVPWHYRNVVDVRTIKHFYKDTWITPLRDTEKLAPHKPVDDCVYQINEITANLNKEDLARIYSGVYHG